MKGAALFPFILKSQNGSGFYVPSSPCLGQGTPPAKPAPSNPAWNASRDEKPTASPGSPSHSLATLTARNFPAVAHPKLLQSASQRGIPSRYPFRSAKPAPVWHRLVRRRHLRSPSRLALSSRARRSGRAAAVMAAACGRLVPRGAAIALSGREHRPGPHPHPRASPDPPPGPAPSSCPPWPSERGGGGSWPGGRVVVPCPALVGRG